MNTHICYYEVSFRGREALTKSPSEFLVSPMVQDEEEFPANTEVFKGNSDEVLRHWVRKSDDSDLVSASRDDF